MIEEAYQNSLEVKNPKEELSNPNFSFERSYFKEIIQKRRSAREFFKKSISKVEFEAILHNLTQSIPSNCDEKLDIYCVINRVKEMKLGLIKVDEYVTSNSYIKEGDFISKAGYLCLEQDLGSFSAVTFFYNFNFKKLSRTISKSWNYWTSALSFF